MHPANTIPQGQPNQKIIWYKVGLLIKRAQMALEYGKPVFSWVGLASGCGVRCFSVFLT